MFILKFFKFLFYDLWILLFGRRKPRPVPTPIPPIPPPPPLAESILSINDGMDSDLSPRLRKLRADWLKKAKEIKGIKIRINEEIKKDPDLAKEIVHAIRTLNNSLIIEKEAIELFYSQVNRIKLIEYYYSEKDADEGIFEITS